MAISPANDQLTSPMIRPRPDLPEEVTLGLTPAMALGLEALSGGMDAPVEVVLSQAVRLLLIAIDARNRGQRICLADEELKITGEIVDFDTADDRAGVDPFPQPHSDHLD